MGCYYTLCHNTYAYSLLFYKVYINRENAGSWNSGLEKEKILGLRRSCVAGDTSPREGEITAIVITNAPLIGRGPISINIFTSTVSSQNTSSSLVSNHVSKTQIATCGLLVVLITPYS